MPLRLAVAVILAALLAPVGAQVPQGSPPPAPGPPKLVVVIVIDQFRTDYLTTYARFWKGGIKRLLAEGAVFTNAAYPYLNTVTCAGHATIATGTYPYRHGIIMNEWWRRDEQRVRPCTHDPSVTSVPYLGGMRESAGHSARGLREPTFADRLRAADGGSRVVTLSMKPRSTVMLAGHGGTAVTWFSDADAWSTSTAYAPVKIPGVETILASNDMLRDRKAVWNRVLPLNMYDGIDEAWWERPEAGWRVAFPHPLAGAAGSADDVFFNLWMRSPYSDAFLGRIAADLVRAYRLGQRDETDFLGVSFSATDYVGHAFGPASHELQDTLVRVDRVLGDLLALLDVTPGRGRYVLALTSDHGVAPIPEHRAAQGLDAGRLPGTQNRQTAEKALAHLGPGPHVANADYTEVYLTDETKAKLQTRPADLQALMAALARQPGALRVFSSAALLRGRESADPVERAAALSHVAGASGDVIVVPKPFWIQTGKSGTTHGTHHPYDQHVPLIFLGPAFAPGSYPDAASPADLAPTLARVVGLPFGGVNGRVLASALH